MSKHDDQLDAVSYAFMNRYVDKGSYSWKHIVAFIFFNLVLGLLYFFAPSTQPIIFFYLLGSSSAMMFRPWTKRKKYILYPFEPPKSSFFSSQYQDEPTTIHNKRIDG